MLPSEKQRRERRKLAGRCLFCANVAAPSRVLCEQHLARQREYNLIRIGSAKRVRSRYHGALTRLAGENGIA
jgi:hypothetical protein